MTNHAAKHVLSPGINDRCCLIGKSEVKSLIAKANDIEMLQWAHQKWCISLIVSNKRNTCEMQESKGE